MSTEGRYLQDQRPTTDNVNVVRSVPKQRLERTGLSSWLDLDDGIKSLLYDPYPNQLQKYHVSVTKLNVVQVYWRLC